MSWVYTDALALGVGGRAFPQNSGNLTYARWPAAAQADLNAGEWSWGLCSAGLFTQFFSNATAIAVNYTLRSPSLSDFSNFSPLGFSGVDLYARDASAGAWRWVASAFDGLSAAGDGRGFVLEAPLFANASGWPVGAPPAAASQPTTTQYRLHFPSYNGVLALSVGVPAGASIAADASWNISSTPPAIYLGTSITQGGLTARPGQAYVSRLSRALPAPVINQGLCGSCRLEPGLAKWLTAAARPSALVIACTENMDPPLVRANTAPFVRAVRAAWGAALPVVLVEPLDFTPGWLLGETALNRTGLRAELRAAYDELVAGGDAALTYVTGAQLRAGDDGVDEELTYEGVHPLDRGHDLVAAAMEAVLRPLMLAARDMPAAPAPPPVPLPAAPPAPAPAPARAAIAAASSGGVAGGALGAPPPRAPPAGLVWTPATALTIRGRAFNDTPSPFNRLPAAAHGVVRDEVWALSLNSAGLTVSWATDAPSIWVNMSVASPFAPMVHFAASGVSGCDLFAFDARAGEYRFVAPSQPVVGTRTLTQQFTPDGVVLTPPGTPLRWLLFLPTYNSVTELSIGTAAAATVAPDEPWPAGRAAVVWYGTSILQGGVSMKVGNVETARVSLALGREVQNFGFSGNCKLETSVAQFLVTLPPPSVFVADCLWNMDAASVAASAVPFLTFVRKSWPSVPIVLAEGLPFGRNWAVPEQRDAQAAENAALRAAFESLSAAGDAHLAYVNTSALFGAAAALDSGTAAGLHASDAGMHDMGAAMISALRALLSD